MKSKKYILLLVFIISLLISLLISPIRGGFISIGEISGYRLSSLVGFIIYFSVTIFLLYKFKDRISPLSVLICMIIGLSILSLAFPSSTLILQDLIHLLGITIAYICYKSDNKRLRTLITILGFAACFWLSLYGYRYWVNKLNYGTFSGKLEATSGFDLKFQSIKGSFFSVKDFKGKYLILDCWYTKCGACYIKMPKVQQLYDKYKDNPDILVYAFHNRIEEDSETFYTGYDILKKHGYSLPVLSTNINDPILRELGINAYPTVLIFDKDSKLIYRGDIEGASRLVEELVNG